MFDLAALVSDYIGSVTWLTPVLVTVASLLWIIDHKFGLSDNGSWYSKRAKVCRQFKQFNNANKTVNNDLHSLPVPPTPLALPIIGHLHLLAAYPTNPWAGFDAIRQQFGNVVRLRLGKYSAVLVSSPDAIREVLITKGDLFSDRPHFERHALIFGNNRQNALALCDWSDIHRSRRSIAHAAVIPRFGTGTYNRLGTSIETNITKLLNNIGNVETPTLNKSSILDLCASIFVEFLLERNVDELDRSSFIDICTRYDFVFYDINQMYLCDFLPGLAPLTARKYLKNVQDNAMTIRNFIDSIVMPRLNELKNQKHQEFQSYLHEKNENAKNIEQEYDAKRCEERFVDQVLLHKQYQSKAQFLDFILEHYLENEHLMTWDECLYEIGDLVGGNSAVANLLYRLLGHLALNQDVQDELYNEARVVIEQCQNDTIRIDQQSQMPLTTAAIFETLRHASSPIVPHLARVDASIQNHFIPKGTMILFNIYNNNFNTALWDEPLLFKPSRFVTSEGTVIKPDYFIPFSHGRRSCLGYKMVNVIVFATVANILLQWRLVPTSSTEQKRMTEMLRTNGSISLPYDGTCFQFSLQKRK